MSKPLVSIILPVYNAQNHIARCLESICAQSWQNIEVIVLNDGSKDQSLPVCEAFRAKDERIVLVDKANSGVSDTRNLGLKLASGKYVQFVDSDDYIDPDFTEHLVTAAEQNNADLVIAPYKMVIPAGATKPEQVLDKLQDELGVMTVARPPEVREYGFLPAGVYTQDEFARHLMDKPASYFYGVLWNKLYRRDLLVDHQIQFTSEVRWAEDLVFNMQYLEYANVLVSIPEAGYYYVQNPQSICHTQINAASLVQNKIQVFHYYTELYTRLGIYEEVRPQLYKFLVDIAESTYLPAPSRRSSTRPRPTGRMPARTCRPAPPKRASAGTACGRSCGKRRRKQCRVEGPARQRPQRISKNNKREAAGACTLRHGFPLFYAMFSGRVLSSRWRRTSWPATRAPRRSGGVPASRTPDGGSCSASPARPWSAHRHDGRSGDGHEHDRLKARKVPYWLSALCTHTSSFSMRMPTRSVSYTPGSSVTIMPGASGWCCGRSGRGGLRGRCPQS